MNSLGISKTLSREKLWIGKKSWKQDINEREFKNFFLYLLFSTSSRKARQQSGDTYTVEISFPANKWVLNLTFAISK